MLDLRSTIPAGPSSAPGTLDLYENQDIMTNSSSLYDDSQNMQSEFL